MAERYVGCADPDGAMERLVGWRRCGRALVSSGQAADELVSFAGFRRGAIETAPQLLPEWPAPAASSGSGVYCLSRFDDQAGLDIVLDALDLAAGLGFDSACVLCLDAVGMPRETMAREAERLEARIAGARSAARISVARSEAALLRGVDGAALFLSARRYPGEPDDLIMAALRGRRHVGLATPQALAFVEATGADATLFDRFEAWAIARALVTANAPAPTLAPLDAHSTRAMRALAREGWLRALDRLVGHRDG